MYGREWYIRDGVELCDLANERGVLGNSWIDVTQSYGIWTSSISTRGVDAMASCIGWVYILFNLFKAL